jgi:type II secretory pathway component PulK
MGDPERSKPGLRDLVTVHSSGKININTAPEELIAAIPGLHTWAAEAIVENRPFKDFSELEELGGTGMSSMSQIKEYCVLASSYFTIIGKAQMHDGRVVAVARAVIVFPRGGLSRPRTLAWREG